IMGEAEIVSVKLMALSEVIHNYSDKLFLNEDELRKYSNGRDEKKMIVLLLDKITVYPEPKYLGRVITMAGEFISKEEFEALMDK
ncbi:DUF365 domain-containing protein, partial [Methanosarcina mazei]|uniref:DUF365 domain-containing protein n=1 Tax=Methanosarcina mazei TaxID=2209 RepID=UPI001C31089E